MILLSNEVVDDARWLKKDLLLFEADDVMGTSKPCRVSGLWNVQLRQ